MKTVEEFYKEFASSKELQEELKAASDEMLETFLKKHGCNATAKDFTTFIRSKTEGEIEDNEAATAVGGAWGRPGYYVAAPTGFKTPV